MSEFGTGLTAAALRAYDALSDRKTMPSNRRVLLETLVDKSKEPITENALRPAELDALNNLISSKYSNLQKPATQYKNYIDRTLSEHESAGKTKRKEGRINADYEKQLRTDRKIIDGYLSGNLTPEFLDMAHGKPEYHRNVALTLAGIGNGEGTPFSVKPNIQYEDYNKFTDPMVARNILSGSNPYDSLATLLGRFNYGIDPKTKQFVATDKYDFNPYKSILTNKDATPVIPYAEDLITLPIDGGTSGGAYNLLRRYAGTVVPPGQGRDVRIQLNNLLPAPKNAFVGK